MVLLLVRVPERRKKPSWGTISAAVLIALGAELFRLYHTPTLDAFRLTLPGALLLGRVFNPRNVVAYWLGIAICALVLAIRPSGRHGPAADRTGLPPA